MGTFANSFHVRVNDARAVADAIQAHMAAAGFDSSDRAPSEKAQWGGSARSRGFHIAEAEAGWVGVLDTDIEGSADLAELLSRQLAADTVWVMVHDSDSWHYQLYRNGQLHDGFDSMVDEDEPELSEENLPPELAEMLRQGDLKSLHEAMGKRIREAMKQFTKLMPKNLLDASQSEMAEFKKQGRRVMAEQFPGLTPEAAGPGDLRPHAAKLRPFLQPGVSEEQAFEVLSREAIFAEEILRGFLGLLGIAHLYGNLSYRYLSDHGRDELADAGIRLAHHLRFRKPKKGK